MSLKLWLTYFTTLSINRKPAMRNPGLVQTQKLFLFGLLCILFFFPRCHSGEKGPGGPILIISDISANPFSAYYGEILRAEGLNEFDVAEMSDISARTISHYNIIIVGDIPVSEKQAAFLTAWVEKGGTLIAFRPDSLQHHLFGIKQEEKKMLADKYIFINTGTTIGAGIVNETLQYHGEADLYSLSEATSLATLYSDAVTATPHPAVTSHVFGAGRAIAFAYDLARSVVYTRQGNPEWQGLKSNIAQGPIRSNDLFINKSGADSLHEYIDFDKIAIPQADEQQRFLCNLILKTSSAPLPRFWYLPKALKAAIVMTGDDHNLFGTPARFEKYLKSGPNTADDVKNWNAVRATSYIYSRNRMSDERAKFYQDQGFEIALHLFTSCADWTPKSLDDEWAAQLSKFGEKYPDLSTPVTNRTHCMSWSDWASQAKVQAQHGIRLDVNYYYWPGEWVKNRPGLFTGSAIPMRFADMDGNIINCYQAPTQIVDEADINFTTFTNQLLDKALGKEGYYGAFVANMHTDISNHPGSDIIIASALKRKIPVISAKQLLTWVEGRNNSSFGSITWNRQQLSFYVLAAPGSENMKAMLPVASESGKLFSISKSGSLVPFTTEIIKGVNYAFFDAATGNYTALYKKDNTPPHITEITARSQQDGTAIIEWLTDEAADSRVDYGISGIKLLMFERNALPKYKHQVKLAGLFPGNTYHFRISSADETGNVSTEMPMDERPLSFTMPGPLVVNEERFSANTIQENENSGHLSEAGNGEITLRPLTHQHFSGNSLPAAMNEKLRRNGNVFLSNGMIKVDAAVVKTGQTFKPGSAIEFEAVFSNETKQQVGFVNNGGFDSLSVFIGTDDSLKGIYAKAGKGPATLLLYATEFDRPHKYRIEWKATRFVFFVDDIESATIENMITGPMHAAIADSIADKKTINVNWLQVLPYALSQASFVSKVYDAGSVKAWDMISWLADVPAGTSVKIFYRSGNTLAVDKNWTTFSEVMQNGSILSIKARYLQFKVELGTADLNISPVFKGIKISAKDIQ